MDGLRHVRHGARFPFGPVPRDSDARKAAQGQPIAAPKERGIKSPRMTVAAGKLPWAKRAEPHSDWSGHLRCRAGERRRWYGGTDDWEDPFGHMACGLDNKWDQTVRSPAETVVAARPCTATAWPSGADHLWAVQKRVLARVGGGGVAGEVPTRPLEHGRAKPVPPEQYKHIIKHKIITSN